MYISVAVVVNTTTSGGIQKQWALSCNVREEFTGWRRINLSIQAFNRVCENLHKITTVTLVAHRQIRRQKINVHFYILRNLVYNL